MFGVDYVGIARLRKSWLLHLSLNISEPSRFFNLFSLNVYHIFYFFLKGQRGEAGRITNERIEISHRGQGSRSRAQQYMETVLWWLMSESQVDASHVEETVSRASYAWKRVDDAGAGGPTFLILSWKWVRVLWSFLGWPDAHTWIPWQSAGRRRSDFFFLTILDFLSRLLPTLSLWQVLRVLSYLLT